MPQGKRKKTELEKSKQKDRTRKNKIKKYKKFLELYPNSPHRSIWEEKLQKLI